MKIFTLILSLTMLTASLSAGGPGTSGAILLTQPVGARAVGLSEAYSTVGGDVLGIHYNPACEYGRSLSMLYQRGLIGDSYGALAMGLRARELRYALSLLYYSAGDIELMNSGGDRWTAAAQRDYLVTISAARDVRLLSVGINMKLLRSTLVEEVSATALAVDVGGIMRLGRGVKIGFAVQNAGLGMKYIDDIDRMPLTLRAGVSLSRSATPLGAVVSAVDIIRVNDGGFKEHFGVEVRPDEALALRAGYRFGWDSAGMTLGLGFYHANISLDYGISMGGMGELTPSHHAGLSYDFGPAKGETDERERKCPFKKAMKLYKKEKYESVLELLQCLECEDDEYEKKKEAFLVIANSYSKLKLTAEALGYYKRALEMDPGDTKLREYVERYEESYPGE